MGWSLLPNALRPFWDLLYSPNLELRRTWICQLNFAQRPIFSFLRFFNESEISDSGPPAWSPYRRIYTQDFSSWKNSSTSARFEPASTVPRDHRGQLCNNIIQSKLACKIYTTRLVSLQTRMNVEESADI